MTNTWIVTSDSNISALVDLGVARGGNITVVTVGDIAVAGVTRVIKVNQEKPIPTEAYAGQVAQLVTPGVNDVILAPNTPEGRVLAGAVAAHLNAPIFVGVKVITDTTIEAPRYGGIAVETVNISSPIIAVVDGGLATDGVPVTSEEIAGSPYDARVTATKQEDTAQVNLVAAKRIVAAGRGFKTNEDLAMASDLASALGGELACSRPLAEGTGWMARDRYIGVSGQHVAPEIYVAIGISGQIQHTAGMTDSKIVIAINSDDKAPIFRGADYGIVGDLYSVLPSLSDALK